MTQPNQETQEKLQKAQIIWVASVRPDGRPHLTPVWFAWSEGKLYISIDPSSVKTYNFSVNPQAALALEDGSHPVICEGKAALIPRPYPDGAVTVFFEKYEWDITQEAQYNQLVEVTPQKWLVW